MNTRIAALAISSVLILTCVEAVLGQAPSGPPKPGPEHQKLAYFAGKWTSEGDMKASPFGPGGKFTFTQNCDWFEGGFAIVCHSDGKIMGGTVKGLSVLGYDPGEKTYTYYETNTIGESVFSRGMVQGDTWTWTSESKMEGKPVRTRFTLKQVSPDSSTYKFEMGVGDEPLKVVMEGKQTRAK
jgi:Protein of unknown function (DUF1579)